MKFIVSTLLVCLLALKGYGADIVFYGDLMLSRGVEKFADYRGKSQLEQAISEFLLQGVVNVANLEGCMSSDTCNNTNNSLCFRIRPSLMELLIGFKVLSLQNNHSLDAGQAALDSTARKLATFKTIALSGKKNSTIIQTDHGNVGIIAATDVVNDKADCSRLVMADSPELLNGIRRLNGFCSAVIVFVHWGRELLPIATERMRKLAAEYVNAGADVVVGTHPHVVGPVTTIEGRPVIFSLGNFLFDQKYPVTKTGALLNCEIGDDGTLGCRLSACRTAVNSFIPQPVNEPLFSDENKVLWGSSRVLNEKWTGAFTSDSADECLVLCSDKSRKGLRQIEIHSRNTLKLLAQTPPMPIRKLQPVDLNNDGIDEVMLIQSIYSKFDKETAKRIHIYSFNGGFHALWRGTALSRPLIDAAFVNESGRVYLIALHTSDSFLLRDKSCTGRVLTVYRWNGFGFSGIKEIKVEDGCDAISAIPDGIRISEKGITKRIIRTTEIAG